jgi:hypothetical protein
MECVGELLPLWAFVSKSAMGSTLCPIQPLAWQKPSEQGLNNDPLLSFHATLSFHGPFSFIWWPLLVS